MKFTPCFVAIAIICFGLISQSHSQQNFDPSGDSEFIYSPKIIRVHAEYYEISALEYADLMSTEHINTNDSKLRDQMLQMAKDGKSKLIETQTVSMRSGERATSESITEYIYPTEYEPPHTETKKDENGETIKTNYLNPIAFETRNVGATFEVEPMLGEDGKTIDLTLRPELVSLLDHSIWGHSGKTNVPIKMPTFCTYRINTTITVQKGQFHLAGVYTPKDDQNKHDPTKKLLFFVKAEILNNIR